MKPSLSKPLSEYSDDQLFSLMYNPKNTDKKIIEQVIDELKNRGHHEKAEKIEKDLIRLKPLYANFWTRLGAFVIDLIILGIGGTILGTVFRDHFVQLGEQGLLIGFFISWVYFGLLNSKLTGGQTPGKMALNIRVKDANGDLLPPEKTFARALIYTFPLFLINYSFGIPESSLFFDIKTLLIVGLLLFIPIHMLINKPAFQAIHDLLSGTWVLRTNAYQRQEYLRSARRPVWTAGTIAIAIAVAGIFFANAWTRGSMHQNIMEMRTLQKKIQEAESIEWVTVSKSTSHTRQTGVEGTKRREYITLNIRTTENIRIFGQSQTEFDDRDFVHEAISIVLEEYPNVDQLDLIRVNMVYGYNIGIARYNKSFLLAKSPDEWRATLYN